MLPARIGALLRRGRPSLYQAAKLPFLILFFWFCVYPCFVEHSFYRALAARAPLLGGYVAVTIDYHINRVGIRLIHRREICIFG